MIEMPDEPLNKRVKKLFSELGARNTANPSPETTNSTFNPYRQPAIGICPTCGRCPTCGHYRPYWHFTPTTIWC